jgi:hypothetical protein
MAKEEKVEAEEVSEEVTPEVTDGPDEAVPVTQVPPVNEDGFNVAPTE